MALFDLPLICTLLAVSPAYAYYTGDIELDCEMRLMVLESAIREKNWSHCNVEDFIIAKPIIEYSKIPKRKRPTQCKVGGQYYRRKWR